MRHVQFILKLCVFKLSGCVHIVHTWRIELTGRSVKVKRGLKGGIKQSENLPCTSMKVLMRAVFPDP